MSVEARLRELADAQRNEAQQIRARLLAKRQMAAGAAAACKAVPDTAQQATRALLAGDAVAKRFSRFGGEELRADLVAEVGRVILEVVAIFDDIATGFIERANDELQRDEARAAALEEQAAKTLSVLDSPHATDTPLPG